MAEAYLSNTVVSNHTSALLASGPSVERKTRAVGLLILEIKFRCLDCSK